MKLFSTFTKGIIAMSALASTSALAASFVYVSNAEDGEIGAYSMQADGALKPLALTLLQKYPTGKGSNWVEIVGFD